MYSQKLISIFGLSTLNDGDKRLLIAKQMSILANNEMVSPAELEIVHLVFSEFFSDKRMAVRLEVAKAVCEAEFISRHLILKIAADCASVSQFVLQYSQKLLPIDLVDYVQCGGPTKQLAIASRHELHNDVVLALIEHGSFEVINALAENITANISAHNLRQIYINFSHDASLRETLRSRDDLPADLRELFVFDVAKSLESFAVNANWLNKKQASNIAKKSYEIAAIEISEQIDGTELVEYIRKLGSEERLTPSLILRSITTGYMKFFEYSLSYLAGIPIGKLHSLLHNPNDATRMALFSRSRLPVDLYPVLTLAVTVYKNLKQNDKLTNFENNASFSIEMIKQVSENYLTKTVDNKSYLQRILDCYYIDVSDKIAA